MLIGSDSIAAAGNASVLDELATLAEQDLIPAAQLLVAATFSAYDYLEIHHSRVPYFLFPDAEPTIDSLSRTKRAYILRG